MEMNRVLVREDFHGILVSADQGVDYFLGVLAREGCRFGAGLGGNGKAWAKIATELPRPTFREERGIRWYRDASASAAVDFSLEPDASATVRFVLAWHAPVRRGQSKKWPGRDDLANGRLHFRWVGTAAEGDQHHYTLHVRGAVRQLARGGPQDRRRPRGAARPGAALAGGDLRRPGAAGLARGRAGQQPLPDRGGQPLGAGPAAARRLGVPGRRLRARREPAGLPAHRLHPLRLVRQPADRVLLPRAGALDAARVQGLPGGRRRDPLRDREDRRAGLRGARVPVAGLAERLLLRRTWWTGCGGPRATTRC